MHVLITGDTDKAIRKASRKVKKLLTPINEDQNEHKKKQLEISHPTSDCPMKNMPVDNHMVDSEYDSFMAEIGVPSYPQHGEEEKDMEKFMQEIGNVQQPYYGQSGYAPPPNPY